jgi:hypothetical protein
MKLRRLASSADTTTGRACSFCHKPEGVVQLIAAPADYQPRAFICDECVAVCSSALVPRMSGPVTNRLIALMRWWLEMESEREHRSEALNELRDVAGELMANLNRPHE